MKEKIWIEYFMKTWKLLAMGGTFFAIWLALLTLYGLPAEPVIYGAVLCAAAGAAFFLYGYHSYVSRKTHLRECSQNLPVDIDRLPEPKDPLEQTYQEMLRELNHQRMAAETAKSRFYEELTDYYTMWVHQIKTPISAMRLLLQEDAQKNGAELSELFKIEQYVEMVLGYLRTEDVSSDMQFQEYQLDKIIKEQIHKYARIFIGKKLRLDYTETGLQVLTDEKWLGFVIGQVLSNSLKYTKTGQIRIYLSQSRPQTLVIEDTGIGISAQDLPRIFEKGFTGHNGRQENRSTGIGLYLCAKIMKKLGHGIYVESVQNNGTRVYLDLKQDKLTIYS